MSLELIELEPLPGRRTPIDAEVAVGRQDCDLTISSPQVSRRHARIESSGDRAEVTDLGSRNGTFVNDERIAEARRLEPGDSLRIGDTVWEVAVVDAAAATEIEARGDVPAPPPPPPAPPVPVAPATPVAAGEGLAELGDGGPPGPSAARRMEATLICYAVVVLTAIGVVAYLVAR